MGTVFADTSYFIAPVNQADDYHEAARAWTARQTDHVLTSSWVLLELGNFFSRPNHRRLFVEMSNFIQSSSGIDLLPPSESELRAGMELFAERMDQSWSLTDCISFSIMRERGVQDAVTSDLHFQQAGFTALLRQPD